jgi:hypothetical protein
MKTINQSDCFLAQFLGASGYSLFGLFSYLIFSLAGFAESPKKQVKEGLATETNLEELRYSKVTFEIEL